MPLSILEFRSAKRTDEIVWVDFAPQSAHEQAGHRPALVPSPATYNKTERMVCCPMTTQIKNCPFEVVIAGTPKSALWPIR
jgi:mRNA interferase MazF